MADAPNNDGANAPAPQKRRRRHKQSTLLPKRPKKALSGYTVFLRNYFNTHPREPGVSSHETLRRAGEAWRNLPQDQKGQYGDLCAPDRDRYQRQMDLWKRQRSAIKRPASAYALYVKDFWRREKEAGRVDGGVRQIGTQCKLGWDGAPEEVREQYRRRYAANAEAYKIRMTEILSGNLRVEDLVNAVGNDNENVNGIGDGVAAVAQPADAANNADVGAVPAENQAVNDEDDSADDNEEDDQGGDDSDNGNANDDDDGAGGDDVDDVGNDDD